MPSTVQTQTGVLAGAEQNGVHSFKGIPYAKPPLGALRFCPPEAAEPWQGVRAAVEFGPIAPQTPSPLESLFGTTRPAMSEDCLSLNVWTRGLDNGRRPVMVWIHGGAFVTGSGATPWYDGSAFAQHGDVVVVTINYRLGVLGFLHLGALAGDEYAMAGNSGILDQVAALHWVQENIAAFGGDPENVTIFGESAGAMSVGTLLGLPAAAGLFRRAILQSGAAHNALSAEVAARIAGETLDALGIGRDDARAIVAAPLEKILAAQAAVTMANRRMGMAYQPVVDGVALPQRPIDAIAAGSATGVSVLAGTNLDEMHLFMALDPTVGVKDEADLLERHTETFGGAERGAAAMTVYRQTRAEAGLTDRWSAVQTDVVFRVPAARMLERQSALSEQTWMYLFAWKSSAFGGKLGSCHALEIPFVFHTLDAPGAPVFTGGTTPEAAAISRVMQDAWIAFARTGDPNHPDLPLWRRYEPEARATMRFGDEFGLEEDPLGEERRLWEGLLV